MDLGFGPDERFGIFIVFGNEGIDVLAKFGNGREGCILEGFSSQDREPDFDLVEPGGVRRREVEVDVGMTLDPTIGFRLVSIEVIEDDVKSGVRVVGDNIVHKVEKLDAASALLVGDRDLAGRHFEGGEECGSAVSLVIMAVAGQGPTGGEEGVRKNV